MGEREVTEKDIKMYHICSISSDTLLIRTWSVSKKVIISHVAIVNI